MICDNCKHRQTTERGYRCNHPISKGVINIPGMINTIFAMGNAVREDFDIGFVDEEKEPTEFPIYFDPRNIKFCEMREE